VIIFLVWLRISNIAILAELRDTRKLDDREKRRVGQAQRTRDRTMDLER
jgi:hypothetical protein